jgi:geranylgeranyl pyrophosphate synthase
MIRARHAGVLLLLILAGCAKDQEYFDVLSEQQAAWNELADVLETVKDEKSMAEAKTVLQARVEKFEAAVKKAQALPKPSAEVLKQSEQKIYLLQRAIDRTREEVRRVNALPGGEAFWKQFGAKSPGLISAVQK